jgi:hypothetical protein
LLARTGTGELLRRGGFSNVRDKKIIEVVLASRLLKKSFHESAGV